MNIYNKTGYAPDEYYRFGVVFIYQNGTLSNVYNTVGGDLGAGTEISINSSYSKNIDVIIIFYYFFHIT